MVAFRRAVRGVLLRLVRSSMAAQAWGSLSSQASPASPPLSDSAHFRRTRAGEEWNALVAASKFADMPGFGKSDTGYIVLQDHGDPVWYRNIRIREL